MRKKSMQWMLGGGVLLSLLLSVSASAETGMPLTSELVDIENVMAIISKVNIRQVDAKTNQAVTDIMDEKSQMYQPGLRLVRQEKTQPGHQLATFGKRPPSTQAHRTFY